MTNRKNPKRVYLLGAGFSKAILDSMPTLKELATRLPARLQIPETAKDLEDWLSHLAEELPWETQQDTLRKRERFLDTAEEIAHRIEEAQQRPIAADNQDQLDRFVFEARRTSSEIVTFNYDLLIEKSLTRHYGDIDPSAIYPIPGRSFTTV